MEILEGIWRQRQWNAFFCHFGVYNLGPFRAEAKVTIYGDMNYSLSAFQ